MSSRADGTTRPCRSRSIRATTSSILMSGPPTASKSMTTIWGIRRILYSRTGIVRWTRASIWIGRSKIGISIPSAKKIKRWYNRTNWQRLGRFRTKTWSNYQKMTKWTWMPWSIKIITKMSKENMMKTSWISKMICNLTGWRTSEPNKVWSTRACWSKARGSNWSRILVMI